jgi:hypothetical protein
MIHNRDANLGLWGIRCGKVIDGGKRRDEGRRMEVEVENNEAEAELNIR